MASQSASPIRHGRAHDESAVLLPRHIAALASFDESPALQFLDRSSGRSVAWCLWAAWRTSRRSGKTPSSFRPAGIETLQSEEALSALAADDDPALAFVGTADPRDAADSLERYEVERTRARGWTWAEVGNALGVSGQAVDKGPRRQP